MRKWIAIGGIALVVVGGAYWWALGGSKDPASTSDTAYYFVESNFDKIQPGMSGDEVRELIGLPLDRSKLSDREEFIWKYSSMPGPVPSWLAVEVRFGEDQTVISAERSTVFQTKNSETGQYGVYGARPPQRPIARSSLGLEMIQGDDPQFAVGQGRYLVQVVASWCAPCTRQRPRVETLLENSQSPIELVLVSIDEDKDKLLGYLKEHQIEHAVAWDPQESLPGFERTKGIPRYALLQDGMICWFDLEYGSGVENVFFDDLNWFIHYPGFRDAFAASQP
ncbi:MAG: hypothetical protein MI861_18330 [Pirellulales bacterium]|nr:hypothetical protein [Pirellulales bacterium]